MIRKQSRREWSDKMSDIQNEPYHMDNIAHFSNRHL